MRTMLKVGGRETLLAQANEREALRGDASCAAGAGDSLLFSLFFLFPRPHLFFSFEDGKPKKKKMEPTKKKKGRGKMASRSKRGTYISLSKEGQRLPLLLTPRTPKGGVRCLQKSNRQFLFPNGYHIFQIISTSLVIQGMQEV